MGQRWQKASKLLQSTIMTAATKLTSWYRDNKHEPTMNNIEAESNVNTNEKCVDGEGRAYRVQYRTQQSVVGGSTPPASNVTTIMQAEATNESGMRVATPHLTWTTQNGCITPTKHVSTRTHYTHTKGKRIQRRELLPWQRSLRKEWVIAQARKRARARAERRRRKEKSETWKTIT